MNNRRGITCTKRRLVRSLGRRLFGSAVFLVATAIATDAAAQLPTDPWQYCTASPVTTGSYVAGLTYCFSNKEDAEQLMRTETSPPTGRQYLFPSDTFADNFSTGAREINYTVREIAATKEADYYAATTADGESIVATCNSSGECLGSGATCGSGGGVPGCASPRDAAIRQAYSGSSGVCDLIDYDETSEPHPPIESAPWGNNGGLVLGPESARADYGNNSSWQMPNHQYTRFHTYRWRICGTQDYAQRTWRMGRTERWDCPAGLIPQTGRHNSEGGTYPASSIKPYPVRCAAAVTGKIVKRNASNTCATGYPCVPSTGAKLLFEPDFEFAGWRFERTYNSLGDEPTFAGLGTRWTHTFSGRLFLDPYRYQTDGPHYVTDGRGLLEKYVPLSPGAREFRSVDRIGSSLVYVDGSGQFNGSIVTTEAGERRTYDPAGRLVELARRASPEHTLTIAYVPNTNEIATVTDARGRKLTFNYATIGDTAACRATPPSGQPWACGARRLSSIALPDGSTYSYAFTDLGELRTVTKPGGAVREYLYAESGMAPANAPYLVTGIVDENGTRLSTYAYDARRRVTTSVWSGGANRTELEYQSDGTRTDVKFYVDATRYNLRKYHFESDFFRKLGNTHDDAGTVQRFYDVHRRLSRTIDARNVETRFEYDSQSRHQTARVEAFGTAVERRKETDWNAASVAPTRRSTLAGSVEESRVRTEHNARGQVTAECRVDPTVPAAVAYQCGSLANAPVGVRQTRFAYCETAAPNSACPLLGLLVSVDGPRTDVSDVTSYSYYQSTDETGCATTGACHRAGDRWKVTNAVGHVTEIKRYDRAGRVGATIDPNGVRTDVEYDARGRLTARKLRGADGNVESDDAITRITYDAVGQVERVTQPDGSFTEYVFDQAQHLTEVRDTLGNRIIYMLDAAGNRIAEKTHDATYNPADPGASLKRSLSRDYDTLSRVVALRDANNNATGFTYDPNRNPDVATDPLSTQTDSDHDPLNRLIKTIGDNGTGRINATTQFEYDARDNLRKVIDPKTLDTTYTYDGLGNLIQLSSPDTGLTTYTYDSAGNRISQTDARAVTTTYGYDALNRLVQSATPNSTVSYEYDIDPDCLDGTFASGRLGRMTDPSGTTRYCYDRFGNLALKGQLVTGSREVVLRWTHDLAGHVTTMTYNDLKTIRFTRNLAGRTVAITDTTGSQECEGLPECAIVIDPRAGGPIVDDVDYLPFGPVSSIRYANGRIQQRNYDANYLIDELDTSGDAFDLDFSHTAAADISAIAGDATDRSYAYDRLHRLTQVDADAGATVVERFTYDATGNRLTKLVQGSDIPYDYPSTSHRLTAVGGIGRTLDPAGNLTQIGMGAASFTYDDRGRLSAAETGAGTATYQYNGRGERVRKDANLPAGRLNKEFVYDQAGHLVAEVESGTQVLRGYIWLDDYPIAVFEGEDLHYIEVDHLGSPRAVIDPKTDTPLWTWPLLDSAFAETTPNEDADGDSTPYTFNLRFPGQYFDAESGLHYNYFRDYEAGTGRYVEGDPIGQFGGLPLYTYSTSTPLSATDPYGLTTWTGQYSFIGGSLGYGSFMHYTFDLESECEFGWKTYIRVEAIFGGGQLGFRKPLLPSGRMSAGGGYTSFDDGLAFGSPFPESFTGPALAAGAGATMFFGGSLGYMELGDATDDFDFNFQLGADLGFTTMTGESSLLDGHTVRRPCSCE